MSIIQSSKIDNDKIERELKGSRGHLVRTVFDIAEIVILRNLKLLHNGVRFILPKTISEAYPNYHKDYEKHLDYRDRLIDLKNKKSSDTDISDLEELKNMVDDSIKICNKFHIKKKLMRQATNRYLIWSALGVIVTAGITAVVTYFSSR